MSNDEMNRRLAMSARLAMRTYALRWKMIRRDPQEREAASSALQDAIKLREMSHRWRVLP